ncbi:hypothetical protein QYE76_035204 [Lolium multiflorum]|uniref:Uncharacterized protein n=1 Tax=Lolium multiflorum TaxID=4521 RepID=A0AAD8R0G1_LOLMU|nr:hypothetical protein QYE76_035204 [Lolium multiflorum]
MEGHTQWMSDDGDDDIDGDDDGDDDGGDDDNEGDGEDAPHDNGEEVEEDGAHVDGDQEGREEHAADEDMSRNTPLTAAVQDRHVQELLLSNTSTDPKIAGRRKAKLDQLEPGSDINLYLELLKEELVTLWEEGIETWDAYGQETFRMKAALLTTVQDYLGYGYIACQVCHGHKACVRCMEKTPFLQLGKDPGSSKTVYMRHRMWLPKNDPWRKRGDLFNGKDEVEGPPPRRSGEEIDTLLKNWKDCPPAGKIKMQKRKKGDKRKKKEPGPLLGVWKRRSVFWDLPYWKILGTPHSLDVMHITKNVCESLLGTVLNMPERTKDGSKARHDLMALDIRKELHFTQVDQETEEEETDGRKRKRVAKYVKLLAPPASL